MKPLCRHCMTPYRAGQSVCAHCGHLVGELDVIGTPHGYERPEDVARQVATGHTSRLGYRYRFWLYAAVILWCLHVLIFVPALRLVLIVPVSIALILYLGTRKK